MPQLLKTGIDLRSRPSHRHSSDPQVEAALADLFTLLRFQTVSAGSHYAQELRRCAAWLCTYLRKLGMQVSEVVPTRGNPVVFSSWIGWNARPTVLLYGHYDVQPADPLAEWATPPFEPTIRGQAVYARGSTDDKGQFFAHIAAVAQLLKTRGKLPVNVKFLLEGEEEVGSPNLPAFLRDHQEKLRADIAVVSDTRMLGPHSPAITYSLRGSLGLELEVTGQQSDLHSGNFGGAVYNPLQGLCEILSRLHDPSGRVLIPGFYDTVRQVSQQERAYMADHGPSDSKILADAGASQGWGERGFSLYERTTIRPAVTINGIEGGYSGPGPKAVIPARATAKLSFRLVPDQDPRRIDRLFRDYVRSAGPPTLKVRVTTQKEAKPVELSLREPAFQTASAAYLRAFGSPPVFLRSGGTIPVVDLFKNVLGLPTLLMGFALPDAGLHAPNEHLHLPTYFKAVSASREFLKALGHSSGAAHVNEGYAMSAEVPS